MAAADSGQYSTQPEPILELAIECFRWNTLPHSGGYLDQPAGVTDRMRTLHNVFKAFQSMTSTKMDIIEWTESYPDAWEIVARVNALRASMKDGN